MQLAHTNEPLNVLLLLMVEEEEEVGWAEAREGLLRRASCVEWPVGSVGVGSG